MRDREYFGNQAPTTFKRVHKPFFVDWDDFISHYLFRRLTKTKGSHLTISEMLPRPEQAAFTAGAESARAMEFIFEIWR
jgi:hypothetical protein